MSDIPVVKVTVTPQQAGIIKEAESSMKRLWDNYAIIGEVQKNNKIKFVLGAGIRDGVRYINIREFYLRQRDGAWMPGRDGITLPLAVPIDEGTKILKPYSEMLKMLDETARALEVMELSDEDNAVYVEKKVRKQ